MERLELSLLGGFRVHTDSGRPLVLPRRKARALLAYLALRRGGACSRETLLGLLWGDMPERDARHSLRQTLLEMRRALPRNGSAILLADDDTLVLEPQAVRVDALTFERLASEGTQEARKQAVALYAGELLEGLALREAPFQEWLRAERGRLEQRARRVLLELLGDQRREGALEAAEQTARRLLALDPLQEEVHLSLMEIHEAQGRRTAALRQYQLCAAVLRRELGISPGAEIRRLRARLSPGSSLRMPPPLKPRHVSAPALPPPRLLPGAEGPFIGRRLELDRLRRTLREASHGPARVLAIRGEAGIGKTRLLHELIATPATRGVRVLVGRCYDLTRMLAFGPWLDLLRAAWLHAGPQSLEAVGPLFRAELALLLPEVAPPGLSLEAPVDHGRLFEAVARLLAELARRRPVLLGIEDLHWADDISVRLLSFLSHRLATDRILLITTIRDEELEPDSVVRRLLEELARDSPEAELLLSPLSRAEAGELVALTRGAADTAAGLEQVQDRIWTLSRGNPFMIVETVRAIANEPAVTDPFGATPRRVRDVVAGRLARLGEDARRLLGPAALIGRDFEPGLARQASGLSEAEAGAAIDELLQRRILIRVGEGLDFAHEQLREVACDQIAPARRRLLHRLVAEAIENLHRDDLDRHLESLGRHYREAEFWDRAYAYLRRAGAQALRRSASALAVRFFEQALEAANSLPPGRERSEAMIDVRSDLHRQLLNLGARQDARDHLEAAEALAFDLGDRRRLALVRSGLTDCLRHLGEYERAVETGEAALGEAAALDDHALRLETSKYLGQAHLLRGHYRRARDLLQDTVSALESERALVRAGAPSRFASSKQWLAGDLALTNNLAISRQWLALALIELGAAGEAAALGEANLQDLAATDEPSALTEVVARLSGGISRLVLGRYDAAIALFERALEVARRAEIPAYVAPISWRLGEALALAGRTAESLALLAPVTDEPFSFRARALSNHAEACLAAGQIPEARALAGRALDLSRARRERGHEAWALRALGEIAARGHPRDLSAAERYYHEAGAIGAELEMRLLLAHCQLGLGSLYRRIGRQQGARECLAAAESMFATMGTPRPPSEEIR